MGLGREKQPQLTVTSWKLSGDPWCLTNFFEATMVHIRVKNRGEECCLSTLNSLQSEDSRSKSYHSAMLATPSELMNFEDHDSV